jgi:hypothetical protein
MLIAAIGYLYVMCTLSVVYMANGKIFIGAFMLLFGGIMPVALWLWLVSRRRRARVAHYREELERKALLAEASSGEQHASEPLP